MAVPDLPYKTEASLKKIAHIIVLLMTAVLTVAGAEPEKFIPSQTPALVRIDMNRMVSSPALNTAIEQHDTLKSRLDQVSEMFKDSTGKKIRSSDIFSSQLWIAQTGSNSREVTLYSQTAVPEADLQALARRNSTCKIANAAGRKVYVSTQSGNSVAVTYLAEDVLMISRWSEHLAQEITASLQSGGNPLLANIDRKDLVAFAADMTAATGKRKPKIKFICGKMNLTKTQDLSGVVQLHCKNSKEAMKQAMKVQFVVPGFIGMFFSKDEKLAAALSESLQIMPQENVITITCDLKSDTIQALTAYISNPENLPRLPANRKVGNAGN